MRDEKWAIAGIGIIFVALGVGAGGMLEECRREHVVAKLQHRQATHAVQLNDACTSARERTTVALYALQAPDTESTGYAIATELGAWARLCAPQHASAILLPALTRDLPKLREALLAFRGP